MPTTKTRRSTKRRKPARTTPTKLQQLRAAQCLSLEDIAKETSGYKSSVLRWETYENEPEREHRAKYASLLKITLSQLGAAVYGNE